MLPSSSPREALLALPFLLGTPIPSRWSLPFPLHPPALISLFSAKVHFSLTVTLSHLTILRFRLTALFLFFWGKAALAYLPTALSVALFSRPSMFKVFCKLFPGLGSTNKSATSLLLSDSRSVLSSTFPFTSNSVADLTGTDFSLLFY